MERPMGLTFEAGRRDRLVARRVVWYRNFASAITRDRLHDRTLPKLPSDQECFALGIPICPLVSAYGQGREEALGRPRSPHPVGRARRTQGHELGCAHSAQELNAADIRATRKLWRPSWATNSPAGATPFL